MGYLLFDASVEMLDCIHLSSEQLESINGLNALKVGSFGVDLVNGILTDIGVLNLALGQVFLSGEE
jgi:hypothetical protein